MSREKNSKKKPMIAINFYFLVDLIRPTGSMVTMVTRYTGGLSQLQLVEMSWEKSSREKPIIEMLNSAPQSSLTPPPPPPQPQVIKGGGVIGKKTRFAKKT